MDRNRPQNHYETETEISARVAAARAIEEDLTGDVIHGGVNLTEVAENLVIKLRKGLNTRFIFLNNGFIGAQEDMVGYKKLIAELIKACDGFIRIAMITNEETILKRQIGRVTSRYDQYGFCDGEENGVVIGEFSYENTGSKGKVDEILKILQIHNKGNTGAAIFVFDRNLQDPDFSKVNLCKGNVACEPCFAVHGFGVDSFLAITEELGKSSAATATPAALQPAVAARPRAESAVTVAPVARVIAAAPSTAPVVTAPATVTPAATEVQANPNAQPLNQAGRGGYRITEV